MRLHAQLALYQRCQPIKLFAHIGIAGFGGAFLAMVGMTFFFDSDKEVHWIAAVEKTINKFSNVPAIEIGLVLVLSGIGFGYLAFDAGVRAASGSSGGWQDAMLAATGTQQMVSATICVSIGARRRSAQAATRACPPRRALTPHAAPAGILVWAISVNQPIDDEY